MPDPSAAQPSRITFPVRGGALTGYRWACEGAPVLIFAHANGFNASTYRHLLAPLSGQVEIVAVDLRGHGRSTAPWDPDTLDGWQIHGEDLAEVARSLMPRPLILAGHSMGATSQILAAARLDPAPLGLALIEPVIMPATLRVLMHTPAGPAFMNRFPLVTNAKARKDGWADIEAVKARYSSKSTFSRWADGMLDDYLEDGLVEQDGEWHLACPPAWEAANFAAQRHAPIKAARQLRAPIHVLQAGHGSTLRDPKALLGAGAQIECAEEDGHLLAMESPDETRRWLSRTLTRLMAETDDGLAG